MNWKNVKSNYTATWWGKKLIEISKLEIKDFSRWCQSFSPRIWSGVEDFTWRPRPQAPPMYKFKEYKKLLTEIEPKNKFVRIRILVDGRPYDIRENWSILRIIQSFRLWELIGGKNKAAFHLGYRSARWQRTRPDWRPCSNEDCGQCTVDISENFWSKPKRVRACNTICTVGISIRTTTKAAQGWRRNAIPFSGASKLAHLIVGKWTQVGGWLPHWRPGTRLGNGEHFNKGKWHPIVRWETIDQVTWVSKLVVPAISIKPTSVVWYAEKWVPIFLDYCQNSGHYWRGIFRKVIFNKDGSVHWDANRDPYLTYPSTKICSPLTIRIINSPNRPRRKWYTFNVDRARNINLSHKFQEHAYYLSRNIGNPPTGFGRFRTRRIISEGCSNGGSKRPQFYSTQKAAPWDLYGNEHFGKESNFNLSNPQPFSTRKIKSILSIRDKQDLKNRIIVRKLAKQKVILQVLKILKMKNKTEEKFSVNKVNKM
jgi:hypothetical protein